MSMEFVNRICPNCKNPNYMVLLGDFSKAYKYKCMNCNGYFNDIDFEKEPLKPVWKRECINSKVGNDMNNRPWMNEPDPEKALEKIFDVIADEVFILEEPFDGTFRRKIVFTLKRDFNPQKVYPNEYPAEGIVF